MIRLFKVLMAPEAADAAGTVLESGYVGQGPKVEEFERKLKAVLHSDVDILTVNSCTSALDLSLRLIGVKPGDFVITTAMTCSATNTPVVTQGAVPVWADVDPWTGLISINSVSRVMDALGPKAKAIIAVDWCGHTPHYGALRSFGIPVIEDAAHAFRSTHHGGPIARAGGDYVAWSFQAIKALTTCDGGALKCPADQVERARLMRWYGLDRRSSKSFRCAQNIQEVGLKYHMNDLNAAIGIANLPVACLYVYKNQENAAFYGSALKGLNGVRLPMTSKDSAWWIYTLLVDDRDSFVKFMTERGIEVSQVHARNDHHDGFKRVAQSPVPLTGLDYFSSHQIAIPVGWWLTEKDREYVAESVIAWAKSG